MHLSTVAGIPIRLHWSFLALVGVIGAAGMVGAGPVGLAASLFGVAALFGSVALHELGHAMTARHYGIRTAHITLYPFGGIAAIERMPSDPGQELAIALAGPAVNFALVTVFGWAGAMSSGLPAEILEVFASMNLIMGLFNLIPAFPMDGGRVLRALLVRRMGWFRATDLSIRIGRGFAWVFLVIGVVKIPSLLLVGLFLHVALSAERRQLTRAAFSRWADPHFGPGWSRAT
jgi:Zn-dependent protease